MCQTYFRKYIQWLNIFQKIESGLKYILENIKWSKIYFVKYKVVSNILPEIQCSVKQISDIKGIKV